MPTCARCGKRCSVSVSAGVALCGEHFRHYVERCITRGARETGVFRCRRIGVALSGGPKSSAALLVLHGVAVQRKAELVAISVGRGNPGLCKKLGVKHVSLKEGNEPLPGILGKEARKLRLDCVVTGHCIEDFVLEMLSRCMLGKWSGGIGPSTGFWEKGLGMPAPLFRLYEKDVIGYARAMGLPALAGKRKEKVRGLSAFLEKLEAKHPGSKHKMLKSLLWLGKV